MSKNVQSPQYNIIASLICHVMWLRNPKIIKLWPKNNKLIAKCNIFRLDVHCTMQNVQWINVQTTNCMLCRELNSMSTVPVCCVLCMYQSFLHLHIRNILCLCSFNLNLSIWVLFMFRLWQSNYLISLFGIYLVQFDIFSQFVVLSVNSWIVALIIWIDKAHETRIDCARNRSKHIFTTK